MQSNWRWIESNVIFSWNYLLDIFPPFFYSRKTVWEKRRPTILLHMGRYTTYSDLLFTGLRLTHQRNHLLLWSIVCNLAAIATGIGTLINLCVLHGIVLDDGGYGICQKHTKCFNKNSVRIGGSGIFFPSLSQHPHTIIWTFPFWAIRDFARIGNKDGDGFREGWLTEYRL